MHLRITIPALLLFALLTTGLPAAAPDGDDAGQEIVGKFLTATKLQQDTLRGMRMDVNIDAKLPKLEKHGTLRALRSISKLGQIIYKQIGFAGDNTVKQEVILRYMTADAEPRDSRLIAITPDNYKFKLKALVDRNGQKTAVFTLTPKKKAVGLFKGELWLDANTGMPLREFGQLVKSPSVFLKKVEILNEFEVREGISFPTHSTFIADTRFFGRAELNVEFHNIEPEEGPDVLRLASQ